MKRTDDSTTPFVDTLERTMRIVLWGCIFSAISLAATSTPAADPVANNRKAASQQCEWKMVWGDEFDGRGLDADKWRRCERGNSEWNDTMSAEPSLIKFEKGALHLFGIVNETDNKDEPAYLTAGITSEGKFSFQYGKVEIRARFKSAQGSWPALWMLGEEAEGYQYGEIDIMEHLNFDDVVYQTVHSDKGKNWYQKKIDRDDWNTYGCEWDSEKILFTVNGEQNPIYVCMSETGIRQSPFNRPFYFILSMQIGGEWVNENGPTNPAHYPASMEVDWVRVYQRRSMSR